MAGRGLGRTRRPLTLAEIASRLGITTATVQERVNGCLREIHLEASTRIRSTHTARQRASIVAAHLANEALGDLAPTKATGTRIGALLTNALPGLDIGAGVRLPLRLTGRNRELDQVSIAHLIWLVHTETF